MINFQVLQEALAEYDSLREEVIKKSRDVLKLSKQVIYAVHRDEIGKAEEIKQVMDQEKAALEALGQQKDRLPFEGSYKVAMQEYVEAVLYLSYVKTGELLDLPVNPDHFLLGLADLPGELTRRAVYLAGKGKISEVEKIRDTVDLIYGELLRCDPRENEARRKIDGVKYELRKVEDLVLQLKLREK